MAETWYVARGNFKAGPYPLEQLRIMVRSGNLSSHDLVWRQGMAEWSAASSVPALFDGTGAPATAPVGYYTADPRYATDIAYAGFWVRVLAGLIDFFVLIAVILFFAVIIGIVLGVTMAAQHASPQDIRMVARTIGRTLELAIIWLYFALLESSASQATVGKLAMGLRVTDLNGKRISFLRASARFLGKILSGMIFFVGFILAAFTERKQALHDLIAGTVVVKTG